MLLYRNREFPLMFQDSMEEGLGKFLIDFPKFRDVARERLLGINLRPSLSLKEDLHDSNAREVTATSHGEER